MPSVLLIVGLGNAGRQHEWDRHNAGFRILDHLAKTIGAGHWRSHFQGLLCKAEQNGHALMLLKPQTMVNRSGEAVLATARYYDIPCPDILVIYDECALPEGKIRISFGGSHAGHNGIRHIIQTMGEKFWRARYGIGRPETESKTETLSEWVTTPLPRNRREDFRKGEKRLADFLPEFCTGGGFSEKAAARIMSALALSARRDLRP